MFGLRAPMFLLCCLLMSCTSKQNDKTTDEDARDPRLTTAADVQSIRETLQAARGMKCKTYAVEHRENLKRRLEGKRLFSACEAIIEKPESDAEVEFAFYLLCYKKGDRSRFVNPAVRALAHKAPGVRCTAAWLLGEIGSRNEAPALSALLSDGNLNTVTAAVEALVAIGGPNELVALDDWLRTTDRRRNPIVFEEIEQHRDELANRLAREAKGSATEKPRDPTKEKH
jgi:HEAT repeats